MGNTILAEKYGVVGSIMLWCCFAAGWTGALHKVHGIIRKGESVDVLKQHLKASAIKLKPGSNWTPNMPPTFVFMLKCKFQFHLKEYVFTITKSCVAAVIIYASNLQKPDKVSCCCVPVKQLCITYGTMSHIDNDETSSQSCSRHQRRGN